MTRPPAPCRRALSTRLETARPSAARSPRTVTGGRDSTSVGALPPARARRAARPRPGGAADSSRESASRSSARRASRSASASQVGDERGRRAMAREVLDVPAQRSQRRAQLVRRIGDEAALRLARALEAVEHRVERRREAADLVGAVRVGETAARVARAPDLAARRGRAVRAAAARRASAAPTRAAPIAAAAQRSEERQRVHGADRVRQVGRRRGDEHAPRRRTDDRRERRRVDAQLVIAEVDVREARVPAAIASCASDCGSTRPPSESERATIRSARRPPRRSPASRRRRVERAGRRQQRRRGRGQLRDLDRARAERAGRARWRRCRATSTSIAEPSTTTAIIVASAAARIERSAQAHRPITKPTPRIVSISGGSPSLRRRFVTWRSTAFARAAPCPDLARPPARA